MLMTPPRVLWCYDHPTARYQEVRLLIDAGAEVVVSLGDPATVQFDHDYHNEMHPLYPDWRATCTLPSDIVERIRRVSLVGREGRLTVAEAALLNAAVDLIVLPSDPVVMGNLLARFKGALLYRQNGTTNLAEFHNKMAAAERLAKRYPSQFFYAPGLASLLPESCPNLRANSVPLAVWVDPERLNTRWQGQKSQTYVTTAISYIAEDAHFRSQYEAFRGAVGAHAFLVLGKNRRQAGSTDEHILGALDSGTLYRTMAQGRAFVDAGTSPEHLIFPPLEAMSMGIPVLFARASALAAVARASGVKEADLGGLGCFGDLSSLESTLTALLPNFDQLEVLAARQTEFLEAAFSRADALAILKRFVHSLPVSRREHGPVGWLRRHLSQLASADMRLLPMPDRASVTGRLARLLPGEQISAVALKGNTGRLVRTAGGQLVRIVKPLRDRRGCLVIDFLPQLEPARYRILANLTVAGGAGGNEAAIEVGEWSGGRYLPGAGSAATDGERLTLTCILDVTPVSAGNLRELRVTWRGMAQVELRSVSLEEIPDDTLSNH